MNAAEMLPNLCNLLQQLTSWKRQNFQGARNLTLSQEEVIMADDMEKKGQQGNQSGQGTHQSGQPGQGQQSGQPGQIQPKKSGQGQNEADEDDQNRDRQRRAS